MNKLDAFFKDMKILIKILLKVIPFFFNIKIIVIDPEDLNINESKMNKFTLIMKKFVIFYTFNLIKSILKMHIRKLIEMEFYLN